MFGVDEDVGRFRAVWLFVCSQASSHTCVRGEENAPVSPRATFIPIELISASIGSRQNVCSKYNFVSVASGCTSLLAHHQPTYSPPDILRDTHRHMGGVSSKYTSDNLTSPMNRRLGTRRILSNASASGLSRRGFLSGDKAGSLLFA